MIQIIKIDSVVPTSAIEFFDEINRGGLWKPNLEIFQIGVLCWGIFAALSQHELKKQFVTGSNQRNVFSEVVNVVFHENCSDYSCSIATMCSNGHNILEGISRRFFNCMVKIFMRNLCEKESSNSSKKIRKPNGS